MELQEEYQGVRRGKLRVRVVTNRGIQFITALRHDATVSDLANRALKVYLELAGELLPGPARKQLTVSAVKQGVFHMAKSECLGNLMSQDDQVEVVIIKAKPKYPHQIFQEDPFPSKIKQSRPQHTDTLIEKEPQQPQPVLPEEPRSPRQPRSVQSTEAKQRLSVLEQSRRQKKKDKKRTKMQKKKEVEHPKSAEKEEKEQSPKDKHISQSLRKEQLARDSLVAIEEIPSEGQPRKKLKVDQQQLVKTQEKPVAKIMPSPKITFHSQPRIQSPRPVMVSQAPKKRPKNPVEDPDKLFSLQVSVSPGQSFRSPGSQNPKTPVQPSTRQNQVKTREKDELSNFMLSRKGSEDKKIDLRKPTQENSDRNAGGKQVPSSSIPTVAERRSPQGGRQKAGVIEQTTVEKAAQEASLGPVRPKKSLLIVQPQSDSSSEQNKKVEVSTRHNSRAKELAQLKVRIRSFAIDSQSEP